MAWMRFAWEQVKATQDNRYLFLCGSNLLYALANARGNAKSCEGLFCELCSSLQNASAFDNRVKLAGLKAEYLATLGSWIAYLDATKEYRALLMQLPKDGARDLALVRLFCGVASSRLRCDWLNDDMQALLEDGLAGGPRQRLEVFRLLSGVFSDPELRAVWKAEPYASWHDTFVEYCLDKAAGDVELRRGEWSVFDVYANMGILKAEIWLEQQLFSLRPLGARSLDRAFGLHAELVRMLSGAGLMIETGRAMLDFVQFCHSPACVMVEDGGMAVRYSDSIASAVCAPDPEEMPDGVHLRYQLPFPEGEIRIVDAPLADPMRDVLHQLMLLIAPWQHHRLKAEYAIEAAQLFMALGPGEGANVRECLRIVQASEIDESVLAPNLQEGLADMRRELGAGEG